MNVFLYRWDAARVATVEAPPLGTDQHLTFQAHSVSGGTERQWQHTRKGSDGHGKVVKGTSFQASWCWWSPMPLPVLPSRRRDCHFTDTLFHPY